MQALRTKCVQAQLRVIVCRNAGKVAKTGCRCLLRGGLKSRKKEKGGRNAEGDREEYWSAADVREDWGESWNSEWQPRHVRGRRVRNKGKTIALCKCNRYRTRALLGPCKMGPPDELEFEMNRILRLLLGCPLQWICTIRFLVITYDSYNFRMTFTSYVFHNTLFMITSRRIDRVTNAIESFSLIKEDY